MQDNVGPCSVYVVHVGKMFLCATEKNLRHNRIFFVCRSNFENVRCDHLGIPNHTIANVCPTQPLGGGGG